ncbi:MAG: ergothioneine biosynthesis protein EgtB [Myxococcota bacterium]
MSFPTRDDAAKPPEGLPASGTPATLAGRFHGVRRASEALCKPLATEDYVVQSMHDASPIKWHLAHTTWYFETFVLSEVPGYQPYDARYAYLFNSYYNSVGEQYPRPERGMLTRPTVAEVYAYRRHVNEAIGDLLEGDAERWGRWSDVIELGLHHEQQHQELMLTDLKHALSLNPLRPAYTRAERSSRGEAPLFRWVDFEEGVRWLGHSGKGFSFDNERPLHRHLVPAFELASRPVTSGEYLAFIEAEGYSRPDLWLSDGWAAVQQRGWKAPLYWERRDGTWWHFTLTGMRPVDPEEPVCHLSYYEADAYARFVDYRLPTEQEWEVAAQPASTDGNFVESRLWHPAVPEDGGRTDLDQLFGDVWEWTRSPYGPYPRYEPPAGAIGEYNGKFMCNQFVLRGGACSTPASHIRSTYRNFFYPDARWQWSGIRLARYS